MTPLPRVKATRVSQVAAISTSTNFRFLSLRKFALRNLTGLAMLLAFSETLGAAALDQNECFLIKSTGMTKEFFAEHFAEVAVGPRKCVEMDVRTECTLKLRKRDHNFALGIEGEEVSPELIDKSLPLYLLKGLVAKFSKVTGVKIFTTLSREAKGIHGIYIVSRKAEEKYGDDYFNQVVSPPVFGNPEIARDLYTDFMAKPDICLSLDSSPENYFVVSRSWIKAEATSIELEQCLGASLLYSLGFSQVSIIFSDQYEFHLDNSEFFKWQLLLVKILYSDRLASGMDSASVVTAVSKFIEDDCGVP